MKIIAVTAAALAGATVLTPALSAGAEAQTYYTGSRDARAMTYEECVRQQQGRQVAGALIGGILGAVVGAEIHDDRQDDRRGRHFRGGRHGGDYYRGHRGRRHHGGHYRSRRHESENDGAVIAGAGLGALAGAAVAGSGRSGCERFPSAYDRGYRQSGYGYDDPYADPYARQPAGGYDRGYNDRYEDDYAYDDPYRDQYRSGSRGYASGELDGGPDYGGYDDDGARTYSASSRAPQAQPSGACRYMNAGAGRQTYMCQGSDGVWRPADVYGR